VRNEPISMTNTFIRCISPGLFAEGVKEIRREYCSITKILLAYLLDISDWWFCLWKEN